MDYKSGPLMVIPTAYEHQVWIKGAIDPHPDENYIKNTVSFSGYFGSYGPHLFAAAPEMYEALKHAAANMPHPDQMIDAALAKAEGK